MTVSGFHTHDGWYWRREADGSVRVIVTETAHAESPVLREHVLPSNEWASVVASVSKRGEDGDTFREAERFHGSAKEDFYVCSNPKHEGLCSCSADRTSDDR